MIDEEFHGPMFMMAEGFIAIIPPPHLRSRVERQLLMLTLASFVVVPSLYGTHIEDIDIVSLSPRVFDLLVICHSDFLSNTLDD